MGATTTASKITANAAVAGEIVEIGGAGAKTDEAAVDRGDESLLGKTVVVEPHWKELKNTLGARIRSARSLDEMTDAQIVRQGNEKTPARVEIETKAETGMVIEIDAKVLVVVLKGGKVLVAVLKGGRALVAVPNDDRAQDVVLSDGRVLVEVPERRVEMHVEIPAGVRIVIRKKNRSEKIETAPKREGKLLRSMTIAKPPCGKQKTIRNVAEKRLTDWKKK